MSKTQEIIPREDAQVVTLPAPASDSGALMAIIEKAALDPSFDVAKLKELLAVKMQWEENEARKAFVAARAAFKAEAPTVLKNKNVGYGRTSYDHATLDNIADTLSPILAKHGLSYSWETEQLDNANIRVTCVLSHELGHSERVSLSAMPDDSGSKNAIQAMGSTVTYLERYTLLAATGIATKDQDDDGAASGSGGAITDEQAEELMNLAGEVKADPAKFLAYMGVDAWTSIPAKKFPEAKAALERKRKAKEADNG
jgi:hypothetical protein